MQNTLHKIISKCFHTGLYCPVCDSAPVRFNPLPEFYKDNWLKYGYKYSGTGEMTALETFSCNNCGASDRERLYAYYLRKKFTGKETINFYHFAPEAGLRIFINEYLPNLCYKTFDLMSTDVDVQADLTDLKMIRNNECDFFICSHVLEHIEDDRKALDELYRITKPGGTGIIMAPISLVLKKSIENIPGVKTDEQRWQHYGQNDHVRLYAKDDFIERIKVSGFILYQFDRKQFGQKTFERLGLKPESVLYVVKKKYE